MGPDPIKRRQNRQSARQDVALKIYQKLIENTLYFCTEAEF